MIGSSAKLIRWLLAGLPILASCTDTTDNPAGPTGSFSIVAPDYLTAQVGSSGAVPLTVVRTGGFSSAVTLTLEGHPQGITHDEPSAFGGTGTVALSFTVAPTVAPGVYSIKACGSAAGAVRCTSMTLTVTPVPVGFFTLGISPATLSIEQGNSATVSITLVRAGPFTGPVWLDIATWDSPEGVTFTFDPVVIPAGATTSTLTVSVAADAPPMVYTGETSLWVAGMGSKDCGWNCNGLRHDVELLLTVTAGAGAP